MGISGEEDYTLMKSCYNGTIILESYYTYNDFNRFGPYYRIRIQGAGQTNLILDTDSLQPETFCLEQKVKNGRRVKMFNCVETFWEKIQDPEFLLTYDTKKTAYGLSSTKGRLDIISMARKSFNYFSNIILHLEKGNADIEDENILDERYPKRTEKPIRKCSDALFYYRNQVQDIKSFLHAYDDHLVIRKEEEFTKRHLASYYIYQSFVNALMAMLDRLLTQIDYEI